MSRAAYWAARQSPPRPLDKLVLMSFADHADKTTGECFPSVAALCAWTGCDRKTVIKSTASLEAAGLLIDTTRRCGKTRQIKVYRLPVESVPETAPFDETVPETAPLNSTVFPVEQSQKRDTEPPKEPISQKTSSSSKPRSRKAVTDWEIPEWIPRDAWDGWVAMRKANRKPLDTLRAVDVAVRGLKKLAEDGQPPGDVLDQSTLNKWTGLFPLKETRNVGTRTFGRSSDRTDTPKAALAAAYDRVSFE